ncbi:MAG: DUF2314 domain-containing protein [Verrucomicrobiota bacterium]
MTPARSTTWRITFIAFICIGISGASRGGITVGIGSDHHAETEIPTQFYFIQESEDTLFLMPRKDDPEGPASIRITMLKDLEENGLSEPEAKDLLKTVNETRDVYQQGENWFTFRNSSDSSPDGIDWNYRHYAVYADNLLLTITVQIEDGRESEPQAREAVGALKGIIEALARNESSNNPDTLFRGDYDDSQMEDAMSSARSSLDTFRSAFRDGEGELYSIKVAIRDGDNIEYFWLVDVEIQGTGFKGTLDNEPQIVSNVSFGDKVTAEGNDLSDWLYIIDGKMHGNYTIRVMLPGMPPEEAEFYESILAPLPQTQP